MKLFFAALINIVAATSTTNTNKPQDEHIVNIPSPRKPIRIITPNLSPVRTAYYRPPTSSLTSTESNSTSDLSPCKLEEHWVAPPRYVEVDSTCVSNNHLENSTPSGAKSDTGSKKDQSTQTFGEDEPIKPRREHLYYIRPIMAKTEGKLFEKDRVTKKMQQMGGYALTICSCKAVVTRTAAKAALHPTAALLLLGIPLERIQDVLQDGYYKFWNHDTNHIKLVLLHEIKKCFDEVPNHEKRRDLMLRYMQEEAYVEDQLLKKKILLIWRRALGNVDSSEDDSGEKITFQEWIENTKVLYGERWTKKLAPLFVYTTDAYYSEVNAAITFDHGVNRKVKDGKKEAKAKQEGENQKEKKILRKHRNEEGFLTYKALLQLMLDSLAYMNKRGFAFREGILWRGMRGVEDEIMEDFRREKKRASFVRNWGKPFKWPAFLSTSLDKKAALKFTLKDGVVPAEQAKGAVLFKIIVKPSMVMTIRRRVVTAVRLGNASQYPYEQEVLFAPYAEFWVVDVLESELNELTSGARLPVVVLEMPGRYVPNDLFVDATGLESCRGAWGGLC